MSEQEQNEVGGILDDDCLDLIAEQAAESLCILDDEQLTAVFERIRRIVARDQASIEGHRQGEQAKLQRLLED